ncbi:MAG TPA: DUF3427 domain-containing protein [Planctomycetota bacterium]|nr:DUF3427 domain-containing protein [Planctomycetota bacterium]
MSARVRGLYETLLTEGIESKLRDLDAKLLPVRTHLRDAEAPDRIALHLASILRRVVASLPEDGRAAAGVHLARALLDQIDIVARGAGVIDDVPVEPAGVLRAIARRQPDGSAETLPEPLIPLLDTALLTNAPGEPRVGSQILTEIHSADRIDVVMAFIRRTGLRPLLDSLQKHCHQGRDLRVLTTTYTGSTELEALEDLQRLGADVRVSYDTTTTRLHAKAWLFYRASGFSTAYIGSSNLTHSAQVSGLEWNVRVSGARNPDVLDKVRAVFDSYWNSADFVPFRSDQFAEMTERSAEPRGTTFFSPIELRPEPFQEQLLEQIELSRAQGHHRNLLAAATGTGKTVMAAIDYARLRQTLPRARLLFVAHRQEILEQSLATFRHAVRDQAFGELWVGGRRPTEFDHVFASIQSLNAAGLEHLDPTHFDIVIVDEFHHAAAPSYRTLLEHVQPRELLGLTATPERSDGLPLLSWFDNRIAAELRLWDAISQHRLVPFCYFGIHDGLDLRDVPWKRGRGYDSEALANLVTGNDIWANLVLHQLRRHADDCSRMRALGFCVSVGHARYMARVFTAAGIPAVAVWADSSEEERRSALADLATCRINIVFSVDLFNEGVDVPVVDTVLFLRPTDSPTLFLQQLGRGLRRAHGKTVCTVLDFVGHHRKEFRFDRRFRALLGGTRKDLQEQITQGFPFLPAGCHIELDPVASDLVLRNIRDSVPSRWNSKVEELRVLAQSMAEPTLPLYLEHAGLDLEDVYDGGRTWSDLQQAAGLRVLPGGAYERVLRRGCARLLHVDDTLRIESYLRFLAAESPPAVAGLPPRERRLLRMLIGLVADRALTKATSLQEGCDQLWAHAQVRAELRALLPLLAERISHLHRPLSSHPNVPLCIHARYSRIEILAAFGVGDGAKVAPWQTGAYWHESAKADLFTFTLDKTSGQFSPTTRYRDYAMSRDLIHWESQSVTRAESETGRRYQNHVALGTSIMLFARLRTSDRAFWFLGPATYQRHESELPMAVTWRLEHPLPADLFAAFAAAVA